MVAHRAIAFTPGEAHDHRAAVSALVSQLKPLTAVSAESPPSIELERVGESADREPSQPSSSPSSFQRFRLAGADLRIERHTEFTTFMVIAPQSGVPFECSALDQLPVGWLDAIPGRIIAAVEIASQEVAAADAATPATMERVGEFFSQERIVGSWVVERVATVWSHFRLDDRSATRFLVQTHRLTPSRYGRLLQRLVEIETYRLMAMLSLPLAHELLPQIDLLESQHVALIERIGLMDAGDERALLGELTHLSLATERLQAHCGSRFSLTESYARILTARLRELREEQVPGYQTISEFFDRRLSQALHKCQTASASLHALSTRLQSTTGLLRTRVEVNLQSQNQLLLASVDRRAAAQLRLQHNVEGLSVVVLTYYLANLIKLALEGLKSTGLHFDSSLVIALLLPLLAIVIWRTVHRVKKEP